MKGHTCVTWQAPVSPGRPGLPVDLLTENCKPKRESASIRNTAHGRKGETPWLLPPAPSPASVSHELRTPSVWGQPPTNRTARGQGKRLVREQQAQEGDAAPWFQRTKSTLPGTAPHQPDHSTLWLHGPSFRCHSCRAQRLRLCLPLAYYSHS